MVAAPDIGHPQIQGDPLEERGLVGGVGGGVGGARAGAVRKPKLQPIVTRGQRPLQQVPHASVRVRKSLAIDFKPAHQHRGFNDIIGIVLIAAALLLLLAQISFDRYDIDANRLPATQTKHNRLASSVSGKYGF